MYYIEPVTVRRSITPRIATIITSNHLLRGIFDVSLDMYVSSELSLRSENAPEQLLFRITEMQENAQVFKLSMNERIVSTSVFVALASRQILIFSFIKDNRFDPLKIR